MSVSEKNPEPESQSIVDSSKGTNGFTILRTHVGRILTREEASAFKLEPEASSKLQARLTELQDWRAASEASSHSDYVGR